MKKLFLIVSLALSSCVAFANNQVSSNNEPTQQDIDEENLVILDLDNLKDMVLKIDLGEHFQNKSYEIDCLGGFICRKIFYKGMEIESEFYFMAYKDMISGKSYVSYKEASQDVYYIELI